MANKQTVTMKGYMGHTYEVTGDVKNGLIIHKRFDSWMISHVATGCIIGKGRKLLRDAQNTREALLAILPDWSADSLEKLGEMHPQGARGLSDAVRAAAY